MKKSAKVSDSGTSTEKSQSESKEPSLAYVTTTNLPQFFRQEKISLCVTTYQANRTLIFSAPNDQKISMLLRRMPRPTGIALGKKFLAIATLNQIWLYAGAVNIHNTKEKINEADLNFLPRQSHVTGFIDTHEIVWHQDTLLAVNTLYSCIVRCQPEWSFTPVWKPRFITKLVAEDRCHLNGICLDQNGLKYVTALGNTDSKEGWRAGKATSGILIDAPSGEIICQGLSMPHSPRLYAGKLFVLESGTGSLLVVEPETGKRTTVIRFHGFLRGLAFYKHYAFVGVCRAREQKAFGDIPIKSEFSELQCGIAVVDLNSAKNIGYIHFQKGVEDLFDLVVLPGYTSPYMVGFDGDEIGNIKIFQEGSSI